MNERYRLLYVEDNPAIVKVFRELLQREGFAEVTVVERLRDALVELSQNAPDAVLLDLTLPDSPEILRTLAAILEKAGEAPVIAVTGANTRETERAALALGAAGFFGKPLTLDDLGTLKRVIAFRIETARRRAAQKAQAAKEITGDIQIIGDISQSIEAAAEQSRAEAQGLRNGNGGPKAEANGSVGGR